MSVNIKSFTDLVNAPRIKLQIPINYFIYQNVDHSLPSCIPLPNQPQSINVSRTSPHETLYAIDGTRIFRTAYRSVYRIEISGRSGVSERIHVGKDKNVKLIDPTVILQDTLLMFDKLQNEHGKRFKIEDETHSTLQFHDFLNEITYQNVHIESFSWNKDISGARLSYTWNLSLMAYDVFSMSGQVDAYTSFFNKINDGINSVTTALNLVETVIETSKNLALNPIKKTSASLTRAGNGLRTLTESGINAVASVRVALFDIQKGIRDVINGAVGSVKEVKNALSRLDNLESEDLLLDDWGDVGDYLNNLNNQEEGLDVLDREFIQVSHALQEAEYQANVLRGYVGVIQDLNPASSLLNGGSFLDKEGSYSLLADKVYEPNRASQQNEDQELYLNYVCKAGENLFNVANNVYGDATRWDEIASSNHWLDAHTTNEGYPARAGTQLRIPVDQFSPLISLSPRLNLGSSSLLVDLLLLDGDLDLKGDDLRLVEDEENLVQAIINRVSTELNELLLETNYGVSSLIGSGLNENVLTFITSEYASQISSDERILSVTDVKAIINGDQVDVSLVITPINSQPINLNIPLTP